MNAKERLDQLLNGFVKAGVPGCSLAVSHKGRIVYAGYSGMADVEKGTPVAADTLFDIQSCTKCFTAVAAMKLYEEGRLALNDPVDAYLPFFKDLTYRVTDASGEVIVHPVSGPLTVRHLMTMTSGIPNPMGGSLTAADYRTKIGGRKNQPVMEMARKIAEIPLEFDPGTHWRYGFGFDVLAAVVESVAGMPFSAYLDQAVLKPLELNDTSFVLSKENADRFAAMYWLENGTARNMNRVISDEENEGMKGGFGGSGLFSTLGDMVRFAGMMACGGKWEGTRILGENTVLFMGKNQLSGQPLADFKLMAEQAYPWYKGYSWSLTGRTLVDAQAAGSNGSGTEFGWCGGSGTYLLIDPTQQLGVAYMQHTAPVIGGMQGYCHPRVRNAVNALTDAWGY